MNLIRTLSDKLKALVTTSSVGYFLTFDSAGKLQKPSLKAVSNYVFSSSGDDDLDNPTARGIYNASNVTITRPTKGTGWQYGFILNLALSSGVQIWFNFSGYIAIRGKGNASSPWSDWDVMQKMS